MHTTLVSVTCVRTGNKRVCNHQELVRITDIEPPYQGSSSTNPPPVICTKVLDGSILRTLLQSTTYNSNYNEHGAVTHRHDMGSVFVLTLNISFFTG